MTVSTATAYWNGGTLVGIYGTSSEVISELGDAVVSKATMENPERLMAWGLFYNPDSNATEAGALWFSSKSRAIWEA